MMVRGYDGDFHDETVVIETTTEQQLLNALLVLVLTPETREYLERYDPMALAQAEAAVALAEGGQAALDDAAEHRHGPAYETTPSERERFWVELEQEQEAAGYAEGHDDPDSLNYRD